MGKVSVFLIGMAMSSAAIAQEAVGLVGADGERLNAAELSGTRSVSKTGIRHVTVSSSDTVLPQFVDGAGWKTTLVFHNLDPASRHFRVLFFDDSGRDLNVHVLGIGRVRGLDVTLAPGQSMTFETAGTDPNLSQGWAHVRKDSATDAIGGLAVFRQSVPGRPDQEAVVPLSSEQDGRFVLLFDNTAFTTGMAIANPSPTPVSVPVTLRTENGGTLLRDTLTLEGLAHSAFAVPAQWPMTRGIRGAIEFDAPLGAAVLGLRFGGSAFTSFHVLSSVDWSRPPLIYPSVPATADITLAGAPDGQMVQRDSSPLNSPVLVPMTLTPGRALQITATGLVDVWGMRAQKGPDGDISYTLYTDRALGISSITGPPGALVGVFLGSGVPNPNATPPNVQFSGATRDLVTLTPLLQQPFYIGSGVTNSGAVKNFVVPQGATRLFLGILDQQGQNYDNPGAFTVSVRVRP